MAEVRKACDVVMAESVRNAMISTCKELELFPPPPALMKGPVVNEDDCAYEDCTAPLPVIAQRLYNDSEQRLLYGECEGRAKQKTLLLTAFFITDFIEHIGIATPPLSPTARSMLSDFATSVAEWGDGNTSQNRACDLWERVQAAFASGLAVVVEGIDLVRSFLIALFNEACRIFAGCIGCCAGVVAKAKGTATDMRKSSDQFASLAQSKAHVTATEMRRATERFASLAQTKAGELRTRANRCAMSAKNDLRRKGALNHQGHCMSSLPCLLGNAVVSNKKERQD
jgi:hypothetical protein